MIAYPKIRSLYRRDENTHKFIEGQWSLPEFEYLANNLWTWTEKVDGTNIRICWNPSNAPSPPLLEFKGKEEESQMPTFLFSKLQAMFTVEKLRECFPDTPMCLYGEGYGRGIQKAGKNYIPDGVSFILFDVWVKGWWLRRSDVENIATLLEIKTVPIVMVDNIYKAIETVKGGLKSTWGKTEGFQAEGLVGKTLPELKDRKGDRIITKLKHSDWLREYGLAWPNLAFCSKRHRAKQSSFRR